MLLCTDKKDIYSAHTKNCKESPTVHNCINQKERRCDKMPVHTINFQTLVDESQVVQRTPVWYLSITESRLLRLVVVT